MPTQRIAILTLALMSFDVASFAHAADPLPTADQLQGLADKKDWTALLAATARVLAVRGPATAGYDRVDVWMKKGEAQLQTNQFVPASQSFAFAAAEKTVTPDQSDKAIAWSEVVKKSDAKGYKTPAKQGPVQTFDIRDPAKRDEAAAAFLAASLTDLKARVAQVKTATEARPLIELAKAIAQLAPIDRVANKSATKTDDLQKEMGQHFVEMTQAWSKSADDKLDTIEKRADQQIEQNYKDGLGRTVIRKQRRGVLPQDLTEIRDVIQSGERLAGTYSAVDKTLSEAGKSAMKPAQQTIQATYDKAKTLQSDAANRQKTGS